MTRRFYISAIIFMALSVFKLAARTDTLSVDIIPDFSTVGFQHSDCPYPDYPVVATITPETVSMAIRRGEFPDTTSVIQAAIDMAASRENGGTVILKNGLYNVSGVLFLDKNNVVLRGESREGTIIRFTGKDEKPAVVVGYCQKYKGENREKYGDVGGRRFVIRKMAVAGPEGRSSFGKYFLTRWIPDTVSPSIKEKASISEPYCPVGRFYVEVDKPEIFAVGDEVLVERPHNDDWISDIGMDKIASNGREKGPVRQWSDRNLKMQWSRRITDIRDCRLYFDAPLVQSIDKCYGGGFVCKYTLGRISGSGIENMTLDSEYDDSKRDKNNVAIDENHRWFGMYFIACENCYAYNVTVRHFGFAAAVLDAGTRCVNVDSCSFVEPVSVPTMARRYGFCIQGADLCLFKDCMCEKSAIGFATNTKGGGPNVFLRCKGPDMRTGAGPHQSWSTGTLYDCCYNSAGFRVTDHGNAGTGHGWIGANTVFWNIETEGGVECESPWAAENTKGLKFSSTHTSGRNYAIGVICGRRVKKNVNKDYYGKPTVDYYTAKGYDRRPDAKWYPYVDYGQKGTSHISLPCPQAQSSMSWWPRFTISEFSNPLSLYDCQLEDRRAREASLLNRLTRQIDSMTLAVEQSPELIAEYDIVSKKGLENSADMKELFLKVPLEDAEMAQMMACQRPDGSFSDLIYEDPARGVWHPALHCFRIQRLAIRYRRSGDLDARNAAILAIDYWCRHTPVCSNWWHNEIGCPRLLAPAFLLLKDDMDASLLEDGIRVLEAARIGMTGQNRVWLSGIVLMRGLLTGDLTLIREARNAIASEIAPGKSGAGVQPDWSFHQHGRQLQFGNYGLSYAVSLSWWTLALDGTELAFSSSQKDFLKNYVTKGLGQMVYKGMFDHNACGRQIFQNVQRGKALCVSQAASNLGVTVPENKGGIFYPSSDYAVYRGNGWYASLRMQSRHVKGYECTNGENVDAYFSADGALLTRSRGDEYNNIAQVWNWKHIPGVTSWDDGGPVPATPPSGDDDNPVYNDAPAPHAVMYGDRMAVGMQYERDSLRARKAWFFFEGGVVCMVAGISCTRDVKVVTTVDQRFSGDDSIVQYLPIDGDFTKREGDIVEIFIDHGQRPENASCAYAILYDSGSHIKIVSNTTRRQAVKIGGKLMEIKWTE